MWYVIAIVVVAGLLIWIAGRTRGQDEVSEVTLVSGAGLHLGSEVVPWRSVFDVRVSTHRGWRKTWFGFHLLTEDAGPLSIDGGDGRGEQFLSHTHCLPGFDHRAVQSALATGASEVVCYNR